MFIPTLLLSATTLAYAPPAMSAPPAAIAPVSSVDHADEIRAAGKDVAKLLALAEAYETKDDVDAARAAYARVLELDEGNAAARRGLGHKLDDGQWFETYAALSAHRREVAKRMLAEHGKVRFGDEWVLLEVVPYRRMGFVELDGAWLHPAEVEARATAAERTGAGWQQQDGVWVHPDEFDKWRAGLWKVGEEWVDKDVANTYHADLDQMWEIESESKRFVALTTCERDTAAWIPWWADKTYPDLVRIFGIKPEGQLRLVCVRDIPQYNAFSGGDPATGRNPGEGNGWSSVHYAFLADALFDNTATPARWLGSGACYYDATDPALAPYGQHAVRHAAGQSYVEAIDPSWDFLSQVVSGNTAFQSPAFWAEKRIPLWLRYGACSYVERYFEDDSADIQNPWWARDWAFQNLAALSDFETLFAFAIDANEPASSGALIHQAGLLVSFMLDGKCKPVTDAHQAFKSALRSGEGLEDAIEDLETALRRNERKLKAYAGI